MVDEVAPDDSASLLNQLMRELQSTQISSSYLDITDAGDFDYTLRLSAFADDDPSEMVVLTTLISKSAVTVYSKRYRVAHPLSGADFGQLAFEIEQDFLGLQGAIVEIFSSDPAIDARRREFNTCRVDSDLSKGDLPTLRFAPNELWECMDPDLTNFEPDKGTAHLSRADMLIDQYRDYKDFGIEPNLDLADENLRLAGDYLQMSMPLYGTMMVLEWVRPVRDSERARSILGRMNADFPDDLGTKYFHMVTLGYFLGEWDAAAKFADELSALTGGDVIGVYEFYVDFAIVQGDYNGALQRLATNMPETAQEDSFVGVRYAVIGCKTQSPELVRTGVQLMRDWPEFENDNVADFLMERRNSEPLNQVLVSSFLDPWCRAQMYPPGN